MVKQMKPVNTDTPKTENTENTMISLNKSIIDLQLISQDLKSKNLGLIEKAKKSNSPILITAKSLSKIHSELDDLGDLVLISLTKNRNNNGDIVAIIPTIYQDNDKIFIAIPDNNVTELVGFNIVKYRLTKPSYCIIKHCEKDIYLKINVALTQEKMIDLAVDFTDNGVIAENIDTIETSFLQKKPKLELPLKTLPVLTKFKVVSCDKRTEKFNTLMVNLEDLKGNKFSNIICNSDLEKMVLEFGLDTIFSIKEVSEQIKTDKKGKKSKVSKVVLICHNIDYSSIM